LGPLVGGFGRADGTRLVKASPQPLQSHHRYGGTSTPIGIPQPLAPLQGTGWQALPGVPRSAGCCGLPPFSRRAAPTPDVEGLIRLLGGPESDHETALLSLLPGRRTTARCWLCSPFAPEAACLTRCWRPTASATHTVLRSQIHHQRPWRRDSLGPPSGDQPFFRNR